jgi:hypothetical protein
MNYLSACCVFRNETRYLREWVEYHRLVGVERFYMISNDEAPGEAAAVLKPYIDAGVVRFGRAAGKTFVGFQGLIYQQMLGLARGRTRWLAFLDVDEFLLPVSAAGVPEVLAEYEDCPALVVNWACFGSSGLVHAPPLQTAGYRTRLADDDEENRIYKSIVDPERAVAPANPHSFTLREGEVAVDEFRSPVEHPSRNPNTPFFGRRLRVNHYRTRSASEFSDKMSRWRNAGHPQLETAADVERYWTRMHRTALPDETIQRFVPELERRLAAADFSGRA